MHIAQMKRCFLGLMAACLAGAAYPAAPSISAAPPPVTPAVVAARAAAMAAANAAAVANSKTQHPQTARHDAASPPQSIIMLRTPQTAVTPRQIAAWIHQLSSSHYAIRRQAKRQLIAAGTAAVPAIKAALAGWTTPRMRWDMREVLSAIVEAQAIRGPMLTLKLAHAPLRIILKRLCRQANLTAQFAGTRLQWTTRRFTINVQRQPFWKVIQRVANVTGISPCGNDFYVPAGLFSFCRNGTLARANPVYCHGALLLAVQSSSAGETIRFSNPPGERGTGGFGVGVMGFWVPGHTAVEQIGPVQFTRAVDNCGKSLLASTVSQYCYPSNSRDEFSFAPRLHWPSPRATMLTVLAGEVPMTLQTAPRIRRISNLASGKAALLVDGLHIVIGKPTNIVADPLNPRIGRCHIRVSVWATANALQSPATAGILHALPFGQSFIFGPDIGGVLGFNSADGHKLSCRVGKQFKGPNWSYVIHIRGGLPATAWAKIHTRFMHMRMPFIFHDVPIPVGSGATMKPGAVGKTTVHRPRPNPTSLIMPAGPARAATIHTGPLVSLHLQHPSVREVLARLCAQVGITAHYHDLPPLLLSTCDVRRQPLWKVLRQLACLTGIGPTGNPYNNYQIQFGGRSLFSRGVPIAVDGAGTVAIESLRRYQNRWLVRVDPANKKRAFEANTLVLWAPTKNHILEQVGPLHATETLTDAHGKALLTAAVKTTQNAWPQTPGDAIFPLKLALHWPPPRAAALALRGTVRVYLSSDLRTLPINNLGFGHAAIQDQGMNLVFGKLKKIPGGWQIPLHISLIQGFFYHGKSRHWLALAQIPIQARFTHHLFGGKELRFYSAKGRPLPIIAHAGGNVASRGWGYYRYTMDVAGRKPTRAEIRFFTRTVLVKLPFNFQHLPILR